MNNKQLSALKRIVYRALSERVLSFSFHLKGFLFFTPCCRCLFFLSPIFFISCLLSLFLSRIPPSPCLFLPPGTCFCIGLLFSCCSCYHYCHYNSNSNSSSSSDCHQHRPRYLSVCDVHSLLVLGDLIT